MRVQAALHEKYTGGLPYCAFNGGRDVWVDVGNKRVGVSVLQAFCGVSPTETLHIGDQFLNTGNDFAARDCCPCIWITSPTETEYILRKILLFGGRPLSDGGDDKVVGSPRASDVGTPSPSGIGKRKAATPTISELSRRSSITDEDVVFDVFTGELVPKKKKY